MMISPSTNHPSTAFGPIRAVIFDIDGVLIQARSKNGRYLWSLTIKRDLGLTSAHFRAIFSQQWAKIIRGKKDLNSHLDQVFQQKIFKDLSITPQQYIWYWLNKDQTIRQDMMKVASRIVVPCYLASNQEAVRAKHLEKLLDTPAEPPDLQSNVLGGGPFKKAFFSCNLGFAKPDPEFFQTIQADLALPPHSILFIDDMPEYIAGAQSCGWQTYCYRSDTYRGDTYRSDTYQNDTGRLISLLKKLNLIGQPVHQSQPD
jgi:putative hydrolase of the HAD superfamily